MASFTCQQDFPISVSATLTKRERMLTRRSADASKELVASSSTKMAGFLSKARAMARRWRWPPLKLNRPTTGLMYQTYQENPIRPSRPTLRVKTVGQTPYKLAVCFTGGSLDLFPRNILITVGNVGRYRSCKQYGVLFGVPVSQSQTQIACWSYTWGTTPMIFRHDSGVNSRISVMQVQTEWSPIKICTRRTLSIVCDLASHGIIIP
jgi:hypothetical protein